MRGLSGGERKRLTIMEAMVCAASITCWDGGTRGFFLPTCVLTSHKGLDAASALDYTRCLRIMTDVFCKTTICSFYQVSDSIFNLFDRVAVLDKGKLIYFGPVKEAKKYFLDLGFKCPARKSTADFVSKYPKKATLPILLFIHRARSSYTLQRVSRTLKKEL